MWICIWLRALLNILKNFTQNGDLDLFLQCFLKRGKVEFYSYEAPGDLWVEDWKKKIVIKTVPFGSQMAD